ERAWWVRWGRGGRHGRGVRRDSWAAVQGRQTRRDACASHRVAYLNGRLVREREVVVPFRDRGFKYGDAAFDLPRTFPGRPFRLEKHVERLYRSLRYLRIDPGISPAEMVSASEEVLERNRHFLTPDTDYWLGQR